MIHVGVQYCSVCTHITGASHHWNLVLEYSNKCSPNVHPIPIRHCGNRKWQHIYMYHKWEGVGEVVLEYEKAPVIHLYSDGSRILLGTVQKRLTGWDRVEA